MHFYCKKTCGQKLQPGRLNRPPEGLRGKTQGGVKIQQGGLSPPTPVNSHPDNDAAADGQSCADQYLRQSFQFIDEHLTALSDARRRRPNAAASRTRGGRHGGPRSTTPSRGRRQRLQYVEIERGHVKIQIDRRG